MRSLLDVNVLIALLDPDHTLHAAAYKWFDAEGGKGWATCPITQNGCLRIVSHPGYPNPLPIAAVAGRLAEAAASRYHDFWPDEVSLLDAARVDCTLIHGPRSLTDVYLLALAVQRHGRLVTFDKSIALDAVKGARRQHLVTL